MEKRMSSPRIGLINVSVQRCPDDNEIEAIYIELKSTKISKSKEIGNGEAVVDFDKEGDVVGIEMLEPCKITIKKTFNQIKKKYNLSTLGNFKIDKLQETFA